MTTDQEREYRVDILQRAAAALEEAAERVDDGSVWAGQKANALYDLAEELEDLVYDAKEVC